MDLIAGLPKEDFAAFAKSFGQVYGWKPEQLQLGFLKVLKGSRMYGHQKEYGLVYREQPPYEVLATQWLSYEELLEMKLAEEMLEIYYNSGQFELTVKVLELTAEHPFALYLELGKFYEKRGLLRIKNRPHLLIIRTIAAGNISPCQRIQSRIMCKSMSLALCMMHQTNK